MLIPGSPTWRDDGGRVLSRATPRVGRSAVICFLGFLSLVLSSCAIHGLDFRQDKRVSIISPSSLSTVTPPFRVRWTVNHFSYGPKTIQGGNNYFAVLVDHQPMPPGGSLRDLGDNACKATPGCPDLSWLAQHGMYLTGDTSLTIDSLERHLPTSTPAGTKESHELVIILMNGQNHRIGESAWYVDFYQVITGSH
jgi:hypothetical protein